MSPSRPCACFLLGLLPLLRGAPALGQEHEPVERPTEERRSDEEEQDRGFGFEAGVLAGHHDNFFFRGPGASAPATDLATAYLAARSEREVGRGDLELEADLRGVFVQDIDNADYSSLSAGVGYKRGPTKYEAQLGLLFNRLFSEEGEAVFFDARSLGFSVRRSLNRRVWVRGEIEVEEWDFDPLEDDRDATILDLEAAVRFGLSERYGVRAGLLHESRDAEAPDQSRSGRGAYVALESQPTDRVNVFLRLRRRDRDYDDAPPGDRNFRRQDTLDDLILNVRWQVRRRWGVAAQEAYREGDSTRRDRNFDGNEVSAGVFVTF